jgi:hypothetical protein
MALGGESSMVQVYIVVMINAIFLIIRLDAIKVWFMKGFICPAGHT